MTGKGCIWTVTGRWRVARITARSVGRRLSFAWCLRWNYTWVVLGRVRNYSLGGRQTDNQGEDIRVEHGI